MSRVSAQRRLESALVPAAPPMFSDQDFIAALRTRSAGPSRPAIPGSDGVPYIGVTRTTAHTESAPLALLRPPPRDRISPPADRAGLLRLQRLAGNRAVGQLVGGDRRSVVQRDDHRPVRGAGYRPSPPHSAGTPYTEGDRVALKKAAEARIKENRANVGGFVNAYVRSVIDVWGRYVGEEIAATAGMSASRAHAFLKWAMGQTANAIVATLAVAFAQPIGAVKLTLKVVEFVSGKATDFVGGQVISDHDAELAAGEVAKRRAALDAITLVLASQVGSLMQETIENMPNDFASGFDLGSAKLEDLGSYQLPPRFPRADPAAIRSIVAGVIAEHAHRREDDKPCDSWGLQCGQYEWVMKGAVGALDDPMIEVILAPTIGGARVASVEAYASSKVLANEIVGKATLAMLPSMALRIDVRQGTENEDAAGARVLEALFSSDAAAEQDDVDALVGGYGTAGAAAPMVISRHPTAGVSALGGNLAEALWLYQLVTKDDQLLGLGARLADVAAQDAPGHTSHDASALHSLGGELRDVLAAQTNRGAQVLIADRLGSFRIERLQAKGSRR